MTEPDGRITRVPAKKVYDEGSVFGVPLESGGSVLGVVARCSKPRAVVLAYFFDVLYEASCFDETLRTLRASRACLVARVGDLRLLRLTWPVLASLQPWRREDWPMPAFVRSNDLSKRAWRTFYSDADANAIVGQTEVPYPPPESSLRDSVWGAAAAQTRINKLVQAASNPGS